MAVGSCHRKACVGQLPLSLRVGTDCSHGYVVVHAYASVVSALLAPCSLPCPVSGGTGALRASNDRQAPPILCLCGLIIFPASFHHLITLFLVHLCSRFCNALSCFRSVKTSAMHGRKHPCCPGCRRDTSLGLSLKQMAAKTFERCAKN